MFQKQPLKLSVITKTLSKLTALCSFFLLFSCLNSPNKDIILQNALEQAGNNRSELEKVLEYYKNDSLKLEAARFLIRNMPYHYSYCDTISINSFYNEVEHILQNKDSLSLKEIETSIIEAEKKYKIKDAATTQDIKLLRADFIIKNIEDAFNSWEKGNWSKHLDFNQFCEYILPYKVEEYQNLDDWRTYFYQKHHSILQYFKYCDSYKNSSLQAAITIQDHIIENLTPKILYYQHTPIHQLSIKTRMPYGICEDYSSITVSALRSMGIPTMCDFTPQWAFRSSRHIWNIVLANNGKNIFFNSAGVFSSQPIILDKKMAKVYRKTFAVNNKILKLKKNEKFIPKLFRDPLFKDVTEEYMKCQKLELCANQTDTKYAYIAVFDDKEWTPVDFSNIKKGKIKFDRLGTDIIYLPVYYNKFGTMKSITAPIQLGHDGSYKLLSPDTLQKQTLVLTRKYPVFPDVQLATLKLIGGEIQASNDPLFNNRKNIYKINFPISTAYKMIIPDTINKYRYWRYYQSAPESNCNIAEISFYSNKKEIRGKIIGTNGSLNNSGATKEKVFDKDLLTFFNSPTSEKAWVGIDFGKPVKLDKIIFTGRGDGNSIEIRDIYELFYWEQYGEWKSLEKQIATDINLVYKNAPTNALFLLKDLTKGQEQRIFTYENGNQV